MFCRVLHRPLSKMFSYTENFSKFVHTLQLRNWRGFVRHMLAAYISSSTTFVAICCYHFFVGWCHISLLTFLISCWLLTYPINTQAGRFSKGSPCQSFSKIRGNQGKLNKITCSLKLSDSFLGESKMRQFSLVTWCYFRKLTGIRRGQIIDFNWNINGEYSSTIFPLIIARKQQKWSREVEKN